MGDLVFNNGTDTLTFPQAGVAYYRTAAQQVYEAAPIPPAGEYAFQHNEAAAVDGVDTKQLGFRNRALGPHRVVFVEATEQVCVTSYLNVRGKLENKQITVTHPTAGSYAGCELASMEPIETGAPQNTGVGTWILPCVILLNQKRLT